MGAKPPMIVGQNFNLYEESMKWLLDQDVIPQYVPFGPKNCYFCV